MSNEIKFRAWDGVKFIYRGLHDRNWYTEDKGGKLVKPTHPSDKNMFIMQFAGLKDKNGIDIYNGDILKIKGFNVSWTTTVRFENGGFCIDVEEQDYNVTLIGFLDDEAIVTVIGNIHEIK